MIKKTLYFGNPAYLSLTNKQLVIRTPGEADGKKGEVVRTVPIEDIGVVVIDNRQITITSGLLGSLLENTCAVITCDYKGLPTGLLLPLVGNTIQNERFRMQIDASLPLLKQMWQQTIKAKIYNQAITLAKYAKAENRNMLVWSDSVRSGDPENLEARAAAYYWKNFFPYLFDFVRDREGDGPNGLLNFGYAILRSIVARSLVASGLLPTLGIHHHNRYNAYCLADDIMEPYRPYVDALVFQMIQEAPDILDRDISTKDKARLLTIPTIEVSMDGFRRPLMVAVSQTTASLNKCFRGELRKIAYPEVLCD